MKKLLQILNFVKEIFRFLIILVSILFSAYLILSTLNAALLEESLFKTQILLPIPEVKIVLVFLGLFIGIFFLKYKKNNELILKMRDKYLILLSSYFLGYFVFKFININIFNKIFLLLIIPTSIFFYFLLLKVISFISDFNFDYFKKLLIIEKEKITIKGVIIFAITLITVPLLSGTTIYLINKSASYSNQLRRRFVITKIIPKNTTQAENVDIKGYNFGWKSGEKYKLMSSSGEINDIKLWTNDEIKFNVPLHLKDGKNYIWIEKPKSEDSQSEILKSNQIELNIISRFEFFPAQKNYENKFYPIQIENITKKVKRFIYFKLKIGDLIEFL